MLDSDTGASWTPLRVWLHPRGARDAIDECEITIMDATRKLQEMQTLLEQRGGDNMRLSEELGTMRLLLQKKEAELAEARHERLALESRLKAALEEIEERKGVDEVLEDFSRQLEKVEDMKRGYEAKVAYLEEQLRLKNLLAAAADDDDMPEADSESDIARLKRLAGRNSFPGRIDMTIEDSPRSNAGKQLSNNQLESEAQKENRADMLRRKYREKRAQGLPDNIAGGKASDEWLLELPEEL